MTTHRDPAPWLDAVAGSHDRLAEIVGELGAADLRGPSYCTEWSVAQVLSHLGSGAEIFEGVLDAALSGEDPPSRESYPDIWARWDQMSPEQQAEGFLAFDGRLVETLEGLGDRLDDLELVAFGGMKLDATAFLGFRLSEHAVHTWDVAVSFDPGATIDAESVVLLLDRLPRMGGHAGKADGIPGRPFDVAVTTTDPARSYDIRVDDAVTISGDEPGGEAGADGGGEGATGAHLELHVPAEAFVRLVYGRMDPEHSPDLSGEDARAAELLRQVFRGF